MAARIGVYLDLPKGDDEVCLASPIWDHVPCVGDQMMIRGYEGGQYKDYNVTRVLHICDAGQDETVPQVAVYVTPIET